MNAYKLSLPRHNIILSLVFLLGLLSRVIFITKDSLSFDEVATYVISNLPTATIASMKYFDLANPPLYYILIHLYVLVMSKITVVTEVVLRTPSMVFSIIGYCFYYILIRKTLSSTLSQIISLVLYGISVPIIHFSQIARAYSLQQLFITMLLYVIYEFLREEKVLKWQFGILLISTLLIYTHYTSALLLICIGVSLVTLSTRPVLAKKTLLDIMRLSVAVLWLSFPILAFQLYPALISNQFFDPRTAWEYSIPSVFSIFNYLITGSGSSSASLYQVFFLSGLLLYICMKLTVHVYSYMKTSATSNRFAMFIEVFLLFELLLISLKPIREYFFNEYYYVYLIPPLFIWLGHYVDKNRVFYLGIAISIIFFMIPSLYGFQNSLHEISFKDSISLLKDIGAHSGSLILVTPCMIIVPLRNYYAPQYRYICFNKEMDLKDSEVYIAALTENQSYDQILSQYDRLMSKKGYRINTTRSMGQFIVLKFTL